MFVTDPVFSASTTRTKIWSDYLRAYGSLNQVVPVLAAWIGGSFPTAKVDPDDIDVLWIVDGRQYPTLTPPQGQVVAIFSQGKALRQATGLAVDTYILPWQPIPAPDLLGNPEHVRLAVTRGYWDDFWLRQAQRSKLMPATAADSVPRRGYLEVTYRADYLQP
jgi:hypothetical protein